RHHLDERDPEVGQLAQLARRRLPRPPRREGADVEFINDVPIAPDPGPAGVGPAEGGGGDHLGGAVWAFRLKARSGVGVVVVIAVEVVAVEGAGAGGGDEAGEIAALLGGQLAGRRCAGAAAEDDLDVPPPGRPDAEVYAPLWLHLRPHGQA